MRAITRTQSPGLTAQLLPGGNALSSVFAPHLTALMGLYAPVSSRFGRAASGGSALADLENLAPGSYAGLPNRRFWRRSSTNNATAQPETLTDTLGPYWDFPAARYGRFASTDTDMPWRPGDAGGHAPGTLMAVARLTSAPGGEQVLFCFSANSANTFSIGFSNSGGSVARGVVRTNTTVGLNSSALTLHRPYCLIFTTRIATDHELVVRDLVTGAVVGATSTSSSGTVGTTPSVYQIGYQTGLGDLNFFSTGRLYLCAFWARGMSQTEMYEVSRASTDLIAPRLPRLATFAGADGAAIGPSVFGDASFSVFGKRRAS